jgi:signal transduction histidine kinase
VVPISADRDRVVQALTNVVGNALTYTPAGGTVRVSVASGHSETAAATGRSRLDHSEMSCISRFDSHVVWLDLPDSASTVGRHIEVDLSS